MANLLRNWTPGKYNALMTKIAEIMTPETGDYLLQHHEGVVEMVRFAEQRRTEASRNPFAVPVETLIARLRAANTRQGWGIEDAVFVRLRESAPAIPEGRLAFLSFRIRFGEGQEGVERTANAHIAEILRVHGRWDRLRTDGKHLRLLVGDGTHGPVVEWCVVDLDANRERASVTAVRGPKSVADEGLVLAWLYADYPRSIDGRENPGYFLAGYELDVPERDGAPWFSVPLVDRDLGTGEVDLYALWRSDDYSAYAVSSLRE